MIILCFCKLYGDDISTVTEHVKCTHIKKENSDSLFKNMIQQTLEGLFVSQIVTVANKVFERIDYCAHACRNGYETESRIAEELYQPMMTADKNLIKKKMVCSKYDMTCKDQPSVQQFHHSVQIKQAGVPAIKKFGRAYESSNNICEHT